MCSAHLVVCGLGRDDRPMALPPVPPDLPPDEAQVHEEVCAWFQAVEGPGLGRVVAGELRTVGEGCHDRLPRWSPDGRRLAYLTDRGGGHRPAVVWTAPDLPQAVTPGPSLPGTPELLDWPPDGTSLLVVVREDERPPGEGAWYDARLVLVPVDGSEPVPVLTSDVQIGRPSASPSGGRDG